MTGAIIVGGPIGPGVFPTEASVTHHCIGSSVFGTSGLTLAVWLAASSPSFSAQVECNPAASGIDASVVQLVDDYVRKTRNWPNESFCIELRLQRWGTLYFAVIHKEALSALVNAATLGSDGKSFAVLVNPTELRVTQELASPGEISLEGTHLQASFIAFERFKREYPDSDLANFSIRIREQAETFVVTFLPKTDVESLPDGAPIMRFGVRNPYGPVVHYEVSTKSFEIVRTSFDRHDGWR
jgi:hypothetical protein